MFWFNIVERPSPEIESLERSGGEQEGAKAIKTPWDCVV